MVSDYFALCGSKPAIHTVTKTKEKVSNGMIASVVIATMLIIICLLLVLFELRKRKLRNDLNDSKNDMKI